VRGGLAVAAVLLAAVLATSARGANPTLTLTYAGGKFTLTLSDGTAVGQGTVIAPGVYDILIDYEGGAPLIQLSGPGLVFQWSELASSTQTRVLVPDSSYTLSDGNPGSSPAIVFRTGDASPTPAATTATTPSGPTESNGSVVGSALVTTAGTLDAGLAAAGRPTLTLHGTPVTQLRRGRYTLALVDGTPKAGLELRKAGAQPQALSTRAFVGSRRLAVVLTPGRWTLSAGSGGQRSFVVR
jgi:hypothetical protein